MPRVIASCECWPRNERVILSSSTPWERTPDVSLHVTGLSLGCYLLQFAIYCLGFLFGNLALSLFVSMCFPRPQLAGRRTSDFLTCPISFGCQRSATRAFSLP